ncbi:MAG: NirD/YgiW/YdeI family stress tolerance protein [Dechloromonas sp.]|nr:NirD/YgiW/YdeI family stress tolerance protein [Dechloromonas sp.]
MKKKILLVCMLAMPFVAQAQFTGPRVSGAGQANSAVVTTVAAASKAAVDTPVLLEGRIIRQIARERYEFADATGTIVVEIDDEDLPREQFDDSTPLRIKGEVDRRWNQRQRYIDVKSVQIVR